MIKLLYNPRVNKVFTHFTRSTSLTICIASANRRKICRCFFSGTKDICQGITDEFNEDLYISGFLKMVLKNWSPNLDFTEL